MDHRKFALRLLIALFSIALVTFWAEAAWDFMHAVNPQTGKPLELSELHVTATMARAVASPFARAYNNILALLLTFISLAIPLTANLYTPKLIEIFIRDRLNIVVLSSYALLAAHSLFAIALSFDVWTPQVPFWIDGIGAVAGWLLLLPYYFYVLSFIDPLTIIKRVHRSLTDELENVARNKLPIKLAQQQVNQRIINLGSVLQRSADRADRDVVFDAIKAHMLELARVRAVKPRLPPQFFSVTSGILVGMSSDATDLLSRDCIWMEHRIVSQLILAFKISLGKMPEGVSALVHAIKNAAHEEARLGNDAVFHLLVRVFNTFLREAIKKKENAPVYYVVYNYKTLIRRLLSDRPELVAELVRYLRYYAEFARSQGLGPVYDLISYELAELAELAYERDADPCGMMLDAVLEFEGADRSAGLVKARVILAGFLLERGLDIELSRVLDTLHGVPRATLVAARNGILGTVNAAFWEINDRGTNIDYVEPQRREKVREIFERLLNGAA
jgi:hypothetical protein